MINNKNMRLILVLIILFLAPHVLACSFEAMEEFAFDIKKIPEIKLEKPIVKIKKTERGSWNFLEPCGDAGVVVLNVASKYKTSDYGVIFKVVEGRDDNNIFPEGAWAFDTSNDEGDFLFAWFDGNDIFQDPIHLKVEVTLVSKEGFISEPVAVEINDY